jgi:hypothetical protein
MEGLLGREAEVHEGGEHTISANVLNMVQLVQLNLFLHPLPVV